MRFKTFIVVIGLLTGLLLNACKEETTAPGNGNTSENYFPNSNGTYYKYNFERTDSTQAKIPGTRSSTYQGTQMLGPTSYQVQIDSVIIAGQPFTSNSYFRKTDGGVYYFLDTTGLSETFPDSLKAYLQYITFDSEFRFLPLSVVNAQPWDVFKMNFQLSALTISIIGVKGYYEGKEPVKLNLNTGTVSKEAVKLKYELTLSIPNLQTFQVQTSTFDAFVWLVDGIGIVRWEGNAVILGTFGGQGISFGDSTSSIAQSLVQYDIKQ